MTPTSAPHISVRPGTLQLATVAVMLTYLLFTTNWRFWLTVELAAAFTLNGSLLIVYASTNRRLPLRTLVHNWSPVPSIQLVIFLVLLGVGLGLAESGNSIAGIFLIVAGYATLSAQTFLKVARMLDR